ncbi:hypothetical protein [Roseburia faecis]|uniref:hypothetical protein n=1 Tax=Roseburia faecis TaxID=301302 RepID=UPI00192144CE|nr:hypothetical protein [Roseburia faecis]
MLLKVKRTGRGKCLTSLLLLLLTAMISKELMIEAAGVCEEFDDCADAAVYNLNIAPVFFEQTD